MEIQYDDITSIIPTLNESLKIPTLNKSLNIGKLLGIVTNSYPNISVIVSDDGSKDKTCSIVKSFHLKNKKVRLSDRKNKK